MSALSVAVTVAGTWAGGVCLDRMQVARAGRAVLNGWSARGVSFFPIWPAGQEIWQLAQAPNLCGVYDFDDDNDGGWRLSRLIGRQVLAAGLRPQVARDWAAAGFLRFEHAAPEAWAGPDGLARWVPAGKAAPLWHQAGYTAVETARLLSLPVGHPDRPTRADLAVQVSLADPPPPPRCQPS